MEATGLPGGAARRPAGELVVINGRQSGARRPLAGPTTFLGSGPASDVRLNVESVEPLHCVLALGIDGLTIRDLGSRQGTYVNGQRIRAATLQDGDHLTVGLFRFRVALAHGITPTGEDEQRAAQRIQVAAVVAQQAALDEEEAKLAQRRTDLQQQEVQLAARLEEQRLGVQLLAERTRSERDAWQRDKAEFERYFEQRQRELGQLQEATTREGEKARAQRERLARLFQRMRLRWKTRWEVEQRRVEQLDAKLRHEAAALERRRVELDRRQETIERTLRALNTERELGSRRLYERNECLGKDRARWQRRRLRERAALRLRLRELDQAGQKIAEARAVLVQEKEAWERQRQELAQELHGLNTRAAHQRRKIEEQQHELERLEAARSEPRQPSETPQAPAQATTAPSASESEQTLMRLAGDLADQRAQLLEHWDRLAHTQAEWQARRDLVATELEALAGRLTRREQELQAREQTLNSADADCRQRRQEIEAQRQQVQVWRARLQTREQMLEAEQQQLHEEARQRLAWADTQLAELAELRTRWDARCARETDQVRSVLAAANALRQEVAELRHDWLQRRQQLDAQRRGLAEKALAVEQFRQEVTLRARDPESAKRIERLRRLWLTQNAAHIRTAREEREALRGELTRLDERRDETLQATGQLAALQQELGERQRNVEHHEMLQGVRLGRLEQELRDSESRRDRAERRLQELHEEVERIAQSLLGDPEPPLLPFERAA